MSRKGILLLLLVCVSYIKAKTQYLYEIDTSSLNYIGLQTKVIDYLPIELSFIHAKNNGFSYLIRLSYVKPFGEQAMNYNLFENSQLVGGNNFEHKKSTQAYTVKSGAMLWRFYDDYGLRYISLNATCTYAHEKFTLITLDYIYGKNIKNYTENNIYSSIELEAQKITRYGLSFGIIAGYKAINPTPFSFIIKGIEKATTYSPGSGFGSKLYINIQVGYHFKFKKKN